MEIRENSVHKWVQDLSLQVLHVKGKINPADIFTKEMHDGGDFRHLRDPFMCRLSDFLQQSLVDVHLSRQQDEPVLHQIMPSAASSSSSVMTGSYLSISIHSFLFFASKQDAATQRARLQDLNPDLRSLQYGTHPTTTTPSLLVGV